jgi:hypothetical protein
MSFRRMTAGLLLVTCSGCMTARPVASPRDYLNRRTPGRIWVTGEGSSNEITIDSPRILSDTIFGFGFNGEAMTYPIASIKQLRANQLHVGRTAGMVALVAIGGAAAIAAFQGISGDAPPDSVEDFRPLLKIRIPIGNVLRR